eukprot:Rmarinus@m.22815
MQNDFIRNLGRGLSSYKPWRKHSLERQAAVAIILRLRDRPQLESSGGFENVEALFIRRTIKKGDPWSGQVAFPGGFGESGESPDGVETAVRETAEEVGIDLNDASAFRFLGCLDDRPIYGKRSFALRPSVFLQTSSESPLATLCPREVESARWAPLSQIVDAKYNNPGAAYVLPSPHSPSPISSSATITSVATRHISSDHHPHEFVSVDSSTLVSVPKAVRERSPVPWKMTKALGLHVASFPVFYLHDSQCAVDPTSLNASDPPISNHQQTEGDFIVSPFASYILWGITLHVASDLFEMASLARCDRPAVAFPFAPRITNSVSTVFRAKDRVRHLRRRLRSTFG